jgi:hypothetical protein
MTLKTKCKLVTSLQTGAFACTECSQLVLIVPAWSSVKGEPHGLTSLYATLERQSHWLFEWTWLVPDHILPVSIQRTLHTEDDVARSGWLMNNASMSRTREASTLAAWSWLRQQVVCHWSHQPAPVHLACGIYTVVNSVTLIT